MKGEFAIVLELATSKKHRKRYRCAVIVRGALPRHNAGALHRAGAISLLWR
jgi:hypothetical protein